MGELHAELGVGSAMTWTLINTTGTTGVEGAVGTGGPGCGARGRRDWPGFEQTRREAISSQVPPVWRAPEGQEGLAAVPVGGGGD